MKQKTFIANGKCDVCKVKGPCSIRRATDTAPAVTVCKVCDAASFETTAQDTIDRWLAGGDI